MGEAQEPHGDSSEVVSASEGQQQTPCNSPVITLRREAR